MHRGAFSLEVLVAVAAGSSAITLAAVALFYSLRRAARRPADNHLEAESAASKPSQCTRCGITVTAHAGADGAHLVPLVPVTRRIPVHPNGALISLVGAGPGSPDLLTVAAYRAIACADVVICDRIASPALRALASTAAVFLTAGKIPGRADAAQAELNAWGIDALRRGRRVVRLKAGDPYLYGRGGEEYEFYASQGFAPDVIPGVSSALSAPLASGIPVTHRGVANQVLISTGHGRDGILPGLPAYDAARTLVLLMAVGRIPMLQTQLLGAGCGYPSAVPVAVIERASQPNERCVRTTLGSLQAAAAVHGFASPAVIVVGNVVEALPAAIAALAGRRADTGPSPAAAAAARSGALLTELD